MFVFRLAPRWEAGGGGSRGAVGRPPGGTRWGREGGQVGDREHEGGSRRWVCDCTQPPVLLAIYDDSGRIEIKVRDRYYIARGRLQATCPRCGTRHLLDIHRHMPTT
jgi:hypothetical protein